MRASAADAPGISSIDDTPGRGPNAPPVAGTLGDTLRATDSGVEGLDAAEAQRRLRLYGPNEPAPVHDRTLLALIDLLANPLMLLLLAAAGLALFMGDRAGAAIIVAMVACGVGLNFAVGWRSQHAAARLREQMTPMATALRNRRWIDLPRRELVPGDIIRLSAGDRVPADARLIDAHDLHVHEAALTGESVPVEKAPADHPAVVMGPRASHLVYLGTSIVAGTATAVVYATGTATAFGDVAASLAQRPPPTEFERGLAAFARLITRTIAVLVGVVVVAGVVLQRPPLETVLFALALAVGLAPEFMPMIMSVTLARAALRMARKRVIVKHLPAIEDFGSMTVLLSDKTGTLTRGDTVLEASVDPGGAPAARPLALAAIHSRHETGLRSPLSRAILERSGDSDAAWTKLDEIPFDFERRRSAVVARRDDTCLLLVKGAPEYVVQACTAVESGDGIAGLDAAARRRCLDVSADLAQRGLRVLAVAWRAVDVRDRYTAADEAALTLAGYVAFGDPVRDGAGEALARLARDGLVVKIATGDDARVARHVCAQVGVGVDGVLDGEALAQLDDAELDAAVARTTLFARVTPAQKLRIVQALKRRGEVVGFLGDGINDAPSLHAADVGISVEDAVDVARDAADVVLRERDLCVLHAGVIEGRAAFANVTKYLLMGTSSSFGNMFSMAIGAIALPFLPLLPTQILLNNFLYDLAQTTIPTDRVDADMLRRPLRWNVGAIRRFMLGVGPISSLYDVLTFAVLLRWLHADAALFHTGWFVESLATQTLILLVVRTRGNPLRSRPSGALLATIVGVLAVGGILPYTALGAWFGFVPLPGVFYGLLAVGAATYLALVQSVKRRFMDTIGVRA